MYRIVFLIITYNFLGSLSAQLDFGIVRNIVVEGNKKTKTFIILRELDINIGDTLLLTEMHQIISENNLRIISTGLFNDSKYNIKNWDTETGYLDVIFRVEESWYLYPAPIFELADRSFNVWWQEQNRSFDRVNYGLRLDHLNTTGRKDRLKLKAQFGYTRKFEIKYEYPYINDNWGVQGEITYSDNKELGYRTENNKPVFYQDETEKLLLFRLYMSLSASNRFGIFNYHYLKLSLNNNWIDTIVADLNPDYFLDGRVRNKFFELEYNYEYDRRQLVQYPQGGYKLFATVKKSGLGIFDYYNNLSVSVGGEYHHKLFGRLILGGKIKAKTNIIRDKIAYANNSEVGYGDDVLTGYELYVLDGTDYFYFKSSTRLLLESKMINLGKLMPLKPFRSWPLDIYLKFDVDTGYVNEPTYRETNSLNNQWLLGYAPGLDFVLFNNFILSVEYHFNELGESGFFIESGFNF